MGSQSRHPETSWLNTIETTSGVIARSSSSYQQKTRNYRTPKWGCMTHISPSMFTQYHARAVALHRMHSLLTSLLCWKFAETRTFCSEMTNLLISGENCFVGTFQSFFRALAKGLSCCDSKRDKADGCSYVQALSWSWPLCIYLRGEQLECH